MKAISLIYQRNGVGGEPFYQFEFMNTYNELFHFQYPTTLLPDKGHFIATFKTDYTNKVIDRKTCRVTCFNILSMAWRGDRIADDIQKYLDKHFPLNNDQIFYDRIDLISEVVV